jgi:hypothetical protein
LDNVGAFIILGVWFGEIPIVLLDKYAYKKSSHTHSSRLKIDTKIVPKYSPFFANKSTKNAIK